MIQFSKFTKEDAASAMKEWIESEGEVKTIKDGLEIK